MRIKYIKSHCTHTRAHAQSHMHTRTQRQLCYAMVCSK